MQYKAIFPTLAYMSAISFIVKDGRYESKEENALWHYNSARAHDGLRPLTELPDGVKFEPIESN